MLLSTEITSWAYARQYQPELSRIITNKIVIFCMMRVRSVYNLYLNTFVQCSRNYFAYLKVKVKMSNLKYQKYWYVALGLLFALLAPAGLAQSPVNIEDYQSPPPPQNNRPEPEKTTFKAQLKQPLPGYAQESAPVQGHEQSSHFHISPAASSRISNLARWAARTGIEALPIPGTCALCAFLFRPRHPNKPVLKTNIQQKDNKNYQTNENKN